MERTQVVSSNIDSIGYDDSSQTLEIEFNNGAIYQYFDVPQKVFDDLLASDSHGKYFSANIKGHYRYSRI